MTNQTFEEYLQQVHSEDYIGIDDDMAESFDSWMAELDNEELIEYANQYGEIMYQQGVDSTKD